MSSATRSVASSVEPARFSMAWFQQNSRFATFAGAALAAAVLVVFLYLRSGQIRSARAEDSYGQAQQLLYSGKVDEGEAALMNTARRYSGTTAGSVSALRLAVRKLEGRKLNEALAVLNEAMPKADKKIFGASFHGLLGATWSDSGAYLRAADEYVLAANASTLETDESSYSYKAAEMYALAGNKERALELLSEVSSGKEPTELRGKARKLMGELQATSATPPPARTG